MVFISHVTFYDDKQDESLENQTLILQADGFSAAAEQL